MYTPKSKMGDESGKQKGETGEEPTEASCLNCSKDLATVWVD